MSTILTRSGTGRELTWNEIDANFNNLNTDKIESGAATTLARHAISVTASGLTYNQNTGVISGSGGGGGAVTSVNGLEGDVILSANDLNLGNVENKSSATIRSEITGANITTALGFYPNNMLSLAKFGPVGNYSTDDSGAFRDAISALGPRGGTIYIPAPTTGYYLSSTVSIPKGITFLGEGRNRVKIKGPAGGNIFNLSTTLSGGGQNQLQFDGITFEGNGTGSKLFSTTNTQFNGGVLVFRDCTIRQFGAYAIDLAQSTYFTFLDRCYFLFNVGAVSVGTYSDLWVRDSVVGNGTGPGGQLLIYGGATVNILNNLFTYGGSNDGPDIELSSNGGDAGHATIIGNRFGNEGESPTRVKIRFAASNPAWLIQDCRVCENVFHGVINQTAIDMANAPRAVHITNNNFYSFSLLVNDRFAPVGDTIGGGIWADNTSENLSSTAGPSVKTFANGGRGFTIIRGANWEREIPFLGSTNNNECPELRNRITYSENLSTWAQTNVTLTAGQADNFGGTTGYLVARNNVAGSEGIHIGINNTSMKNSEGGAATGQDGHFNVSFWAKKGSLDCVLVGLQDSTSGFVGLQYVQLSSGWREHKLPFNGLNTSHAFSLYFFPGSTFAMAGDMYLDRVQVADFDSDYVPTSGAVYGNTTFGSRLKKAIQLTGVSLAQRTITTNDAFTGYDTTLLLNSATLTATLPTAVGIRGRRYTAKLIAASTTGTIATTSSQTIDGASTYSLSARWKYVTVESDDANWIIVANN